MNDMALILIDTGCKFESSRDESRLVEAGDFNVNVNVNVKSQCHNQNQSQHFLFFQTG
jgi:hypothetical protein